LTKSDIAKIAAELKPHIEAVIREAIAERLKEREQTSAGGAGSFMANLQ
jgi:hypothetical protein